MNRFYVRKLSIEFQEGSPDRSFTEAEARRFAEVLTATFSPPEIYEAYLSVRSRVKRVLTAQTKEVEAFRGGVQWRAQQIMSISRSSDTVVARDEDQVISMGSHRKLGDTREGRAVVLLEKFITLPEYEGRGISREITQREFEKIKTKYTDPIFVVLTREQKIKDSYLRKGFKLLPIREYFSWLLEKRILSEMIDEESILAEERAGVMVLIKE